VPVGLPPGAVPEGGSIMHTLLVLMFAPIALVVGIALIGILLDPRFWLFMIIMGALLMLGLSLQPAKASVLGHQILVAQESFSAAASGPRCEGRLTTDLAGGAHGVT